MLEEPRTRKPDAQRSQDRQPVDADESTDPGADPPASTSSVAVDELFDVLKNQRRRYVLRYLQSVSDHVRLGELAEQIAAWEQDKEVRQISSQERKRVYVGLYQCHLPKMDAVDAISYNKPRGKIERGQRFDLFTEYLPRHATSTGRTIAGPLGEFVTSILR